MFEIQKSSRHAAHHAEAAGDGREHGNDEIDDSFQGFLFHSFNFLMFTSFITFVFPFVPPFPFCSLWKTSKWPNAQMTNYHISRLLALLACWGFNDNRDNPFLLPVPACKRASSKRVNIWGIWTARLCSPSSRTSCRLSCENPQVTFACSFLTVKPLLIDDFWQCKDMKSENGS